MISAICSPVALDNLTFTGVETGGNLYKLVPDRS